MKRITERFFVLLFCALLFTGAAEAGNFTELQDAISQTAAGGVLSLSGDYTYDLSADTALSVEGIIIDKSITIDGGNHIVDAMGMVRVFKVMGTNVLFKNLTITKGGYVEADSKKGTVSGGGVYVGRGLVVDFDSVKITKCGTEKGVHTRDGGAALFVDAKAKVTFKNCEISGNTGKDRAGGMYLIGNAELHNTKIIDNICGSRGGGIYVDPGFASPERGGEWGGNIKMYGCTVSGNKGGRGGGIYVNPENDTLNIFENCTISSNDVSEDGKGNGGGMLFYNAHGNLINCTITNNKAKNGGGVILDVLSNLELTNCTIAANVATVGGAGFYAHDGSYVSNGMRTVGVADFKGCVIVGNTLFDGTPQDVSVHYTDFSANVPEWKRYDGNFVSGGYNVLGTVDLTKPDGVSEDVTITLADSDVKDAVANEVLVYEGGIPALKDNGGSVPTAALADKSAALEIIPAGTAWIPAADARGVSRPQGPKADAGAYEKQVDGGSSSGCSTASFPLLLLALGGAAVFFRKR